MSERTAVRDHARYIVGLVDKLEVLEAQNARLVKVIRQSADVIGQATTDRQMKFACMRAHRMLVDGLRAEEL